MHLQEKDTVYPKQFSMNKIDKIVAISPYVFEEFYRLLKLPRDKMIMIYNVVDLEKFNKKKDKNSKYNLGIIGICPKRKRLDLAVDIFEGLWQKDNRYKLYIKGKLPQDYTWLWNKEDERNYFEKVFERIETAPWRDSVIFDGFGNDIDLWLTK